MSVAAWIETAISGLGDGCILVTEMTQANLRWANNSLTTNGQMHSRTATAIRFTDAGDVIQTTQVASADDLVELVVAVGGRYPGEPTPATSNPATTFDEVVDRLAGSEHRPSPAVSADATEHGSAPFELPAEPGSIDIFDSFAQDLGRGFGEAKARGVNLFGFAEHQLRTQWLATTAGIRRRAVVPTGRLELNGKDGTGTNSAWFGQYSLDFTDVDLEAALAEIWRRLAWGETRLELPAGRYEVLLPPSAVADLLIYTYWTMTGRDAREGRNVFTAGEGATKLGQRLSELPINMWSDPNYPGLPCADFAFTPANSPGQLSVRDNGLAVGRVDWLTDGVLTNLIEPTTPGHRMAYPTENLICDAGATSSLEELIAGTRRGLLLTCLWYIREVDPATLLLTGLTRDGVYLIEDGEVVGAVNNFRFNESPVSLLARATEASAAEITLCREWNDYFTKSKVPALRIPDFNMSTVSKAS